MPNLPFSFLFCPHLHLHPKPLLHQLLWNNVLLLWQWFWVMSVSPSFQNILFLPAFQWAMQQAWHSLICKNTAVWVHILSLTESPCLLMAESLTLHWWKAFLTQQMSGLAQRSGEWSWSPGLIGKVLQVKPVYTKTTLISPTAPSHEPLKDALKAECGHIECHNHNFLQQSPQKYLSGRTSLRYERASWFFMWQKTSGSSQEVSEVVVLCSMSCTPT